MLDATGLLVMPGGIDPHTHLEMPFMGQVSCESFYSGHRAALAGGTTMHVDFALAVDGDPLKGYERWREMADRGAMDYALHVSVDGWRGEATRKSMEEVVARGVNSFKFFLAYKGALMVKDDEFVEGLEACRDLGALAMVHAENGEAVDVGQRRVLAAGITGPEGHALSRPPIVEIEATQRAIALARLANAPLYVVHVMSGGAAEAIARARLDGARVVGEAVAAALALDESVMWNANWTEAARFVMSPPIKSAADRQKVRRALAGGALSLTGTDHAVFSDAQKAAGKAKQDFRVIPNGVNGIGERMHVVWEELVNAGLASPSDFVRVTSTEAAKLFNVYPRKGLVAPGSDADVVLFDPKEKHIISVDTHHSVLDYNVFEGKPVTGKVVSTISRGRLVWHDGKLEVPTNSARFVPTPPFGPIFDGLGKRDVYELYRAYGDIPVARTAPGVSNAQKDEL